MGELTGTFDGSADSPEAQLDKERDQAVEPERQEGEGEGGETEIKGVETPVKDCYADAVNKRDGLPVFKVGHEEFYQNMNYGRQRIRFKSGTPAQKFMQGSRYKQSFWIQHEKDGYMRKVK